MIEKTAASLGGSVEGFYYAFGGVDVYVILEMPDNTSMAALALAANASGAVSVTTTVLMTPEEVDAVAKKTPAYRPPGK